MIRRIMVLSAFALTASISAASAASMPNFQGFYIGAHAGYGWEDIDYSGNFAASFDTDGFVTRVEFFAGASPLGALLEEPFSLTWSNVPAVKTEELGSS